MEKIIKIMQDFGYSEHEYKFYAEMPSNLAKREKETTYDLGSQHVVQGYWTASKRQAQDGREYYVNNFYISKLK